MSGTISTWVRGDLRKSIALLVAAGALWECAAQVGDMAGMVAMPSGLKQPWRQEGPKAVPGPPRPKSFPAVQLLAAQTAASSNADAPDPGPRPVRETVASLEPISEPASTGQALDNSRQVGTEAEVDAVEEPGPDLALEPEPEPGLEAALESSDLSGAAGAGPPFAAVDSDVRFPELPDSPTATETEFHDQARRILKSLLADDRDDPSTLLSLQDKLANDLALARLRDAWGELLERGIARAQTLQRVNAAVRGLRTAFENASPTDEPGVYKDVDQALCLSAFAHIHEAEPGAIELAITVPNLGRLRLADIEQVCNSSSEAELASRSFPEVLGPAKLRKLVRRSYRRAFKRHKVRAVTIPEAGWEVLDEGERRVLHAIVGVRTTGPSPEAACLMQEITIEQKKKRHRFGRPICCKIESTVAIKCSELGKSQRERMTP